MIGSGMEFFHYREPLLPRIEWQHEHADVVVRSAKNREARLGAVAELHLPLEGVGHAWLGRARGRRRRAVGHAFLVRRGRCDAAQSHGGVARRVKRADELSCCRRRIRRFCSVARRRVDIDAFRDGRGGTPFHAAAAVASKEQQYH